ncbi:MAG: hypothetical protein LBS48_04335 [Treponema sp.]|jgi:hypothetical protein|nr:hypothetical protein [Treponema sp.]
MKKTLVFVSVWLALTAVCGGGLLFAGGAISRETASQSKVADVADVAEVPESDFEPRSNPNVKRASGNVYALPAGPLSPEAERLPPPVYAIAGIRGVEIREGSPWEVVDVIVNLPEKETFSRGILEGEDVSEWIQNLPPGLEARAHGIKKGAKTIRIYISGTPAVTMRERVNVNIPGTYLTGGNPRLFVSPTEQESLESWAKTQTE